MRSIGRRTGWGWGWERYEGDKGTGWGLEALKEYERRNLKVSTSEAMVAEQVLEDETRREGSPESSSVVDIQWPLPMLQEHFL
jgi:hypothetical protein